MGPKGRQKCSKGRQACKLTGIERPKASLSTPIRRFFDNLLLGGCHPCLAFPAIGRLFAPDFDSSLSRGAGIFAIPPPDAYDVVGGRPASID